MTYDREYYEKNKEVIRDNQRRYYERHKERIQAKSRSEEWRAHRREYYAANKKAFNARARENYYANREEILAWQKDYSQRPEVKERVKNHRQSEEFKARQRQRYKERYANDPEFRERRCQRARAFHRKKAGQKPIPPTWEVELKQVERLRSKIKSIKRKKKYLHEYRLKNLERLKNNASQWRQLKYEEKIQKLASDKELLASVIESVRPKIVRSELGKKKPLGEVYLRHRDKYVSRKQIPEVKAKNRKYMESYTKKKKSEIRERAYLRYHELGKCNCCGIIGPSEEIKNDRLPLDDYEFKCEKCWKQQLPTLRIIEKLNKHIEDHNKNCAVTGMRTRFLRNTLKIIPLFKG